ncbi:Bgt-50226 [Blumeria graminis f. sp. tritici]|uniref:Bgt-50226 n=1 Tax=Blumeria graminis f. sp. tritici TaxID=62690 RepID=A0A9X9MG68_BLUGR|nr:Bgt-50226 [Blumeria graminis f. sp. tritici]
MVGWLRGKLISSSRAAISQLVLPMTGETFLLWAN